MNTSIVLAIICDDRPGIVKLLSQTLEAHGGNWIESHMASLSGKFAGAVLVSVPAAQAEAFAAALAGLESPGLHIVAQRCGEPAKTAPLREFSLELVGQDRPGIIHDVTDILARHGVNVQELKTRCESASMSGETLFLANARMQIPATVAVPVLRQELEALANELMVDIDLKE